MKKLAFVLLLLVGASCGDDSAESEFGVPLDEDGKNSLLQTGFEDSSDKSDAAIGRLGLSSSVGADTAVWEVRNQWFDSQTANANKAGLAWDENSGLDWEQKFNAWVDSLESTPRANNNYGNTYKIVTPWGTEIDSPALECAESAMFLRVTFASWYGLPFFMEAIDGRGKRVFFGHFGVRTEDGIYPTMPSFKTRYPDYSDKAASVAGGGEWPSDTNLAKRTLAGGRDDLQPMIGEGAHAGAYFDRLFLNKRVGYYLLIHLAFLGSANLADPANMYNITPESIEPGDVLVERWQRAGIGHVLMVMNVLKLGEQILDEVTVPVLEAELASGSMPRRQPVWDNPNGSKRYFTMEETGGGEYVDFGGGIKRWRTPIIKSGRWTAAVLDADMEDFIPTTQKLKLSERPERFKLILKTLTNAQKLESLAEIIEAKRMHLREYPASCSARINREKAFDDLYLVGESMGLSRADIDRDHRMLEDYVFAELEYEKSKTCCWNSSTAGMFDIVMQYNESIQNDPNAIECPALAVFKAEGAGDGYDQFRAYAILNDRGDEWVAWRADETCPQANTTADVEVEHAWTDFCDIRDAFVVATP